MQQISAHGGFAPQHDPFAALMSLQSERTQVVFSGLEFHPCDTRLYRTLQTRPEKRFTEASPHGSLSASPCQAHHSDAVCDATKALYRTNPLPEGRRVRRPAARLARCALRRTRLQI